MNAKTLTVPDDPEPDDLLNRLVSGTTALDKRQESRLPADYVAKPAAGFDPRLAYELALEMDTPTGTFERYGYGIDEATRIMAMPGFIATVRKYRDEIVGTGVSFRLKAKVQAEDLLTHSYEMATDPEVPPAVRADLIKWTAKVANLEPKDKGEGAGAGAGFTLNISFGGGPAPTVAVTTERPAIDVTPTRE